MILCLDAHDTPTFEAMPTSELLLSLPPRMCEQIAECEPEIAEQAFFSHDPIAVSYTHLTLPTIPLV